VSPPRVVLDTNVLISSLWGGLPRRLIRCWQTGQLRLLLSQAILAEYLTVLGRFQPTPEDLDTFVALLGHPRLTEWVAPAVRLHIVTADLPDNRFLECALVGHAEALISGDRHLLRLRYFHNIPIVSPAQFLRRFPALR
jgi:putative PIN family toxin of toxin-antitoxin system